jgi:hypothetical protein
MGWKRIKEVMAVLLIGDGVISILEPKRHSKLWAKGPVVYRKAMKPFTRDPVVVQLVGLGLVGVGFWLASRQRE